MKPRKNLPFLVFGLLFFTVGCIGSVGSWSTYRLDTGIVRNGQRADGHITRKIFLYSADGDSDYVVEYWFDLPSGERVKSSSGVNKRLWKTLHKGQTIVVCYSAEDTKRNFPLGGGVTSLGVTIYLSVLCALFAVCGALGERGGTPMKLCVANDIPLW